MRDLLIGIVAGIIGLIAMTPDAEAQRTRNGHSTTTIPPIMVWTELSKADVENLLPKGATLTESRGSGYQITNLPNNPSFAVDLSFACSQKGMSTPRFGKPGTTDPGKPTRRQYQLAQMLGELFMNMIQNDLAIDNDKPFPAGPIPNPVLVRKRLKEIGQGPGGPFVGPGDGNKKGKWVKVCAPIDPCVRPALPVPLDVSDCSDEQKEVNRLYEKYLHWENQVRLCAEVLKALDAKDAISDNFNNIIDVFTAYAVATAPAGTAPIVVPVVLTGYAVKKVKDIILDFGLYLAGLTKADVAAQCDKFERYAASYGRGLRDALAELRACKEAAAEAAEQNTAAFQNYINKTLPAYYDCLKQRECRWKWIAGE